MPVSFVIAMLPNVITHELSNIADPRARYGATVSRSPRSARCSAPTARRSRPFAARSPVISV